MGRRNFWPWLGVVLLAAAVLLPVRGSAYVPTAGHLLAAASDRRGTPSTAVIRHTRIVLPQQAGDTARRYRETVYFRFPGAFRFERDTDGGHRIYLERSGVYRIVAQARVSRLPPEPMDLALRLLAGTNAAGLQRVLADAGLDLSIASLGRFDDRLGFVLGARYPDESVPQVWFDKETLLPFRWLLIRRSADGSIQRTEIRYRSWQDTGGFFYPQAVACYRDERKVCEVRVDDVEVGAEIEAERFSFEQLLNRYPSEAASTLGGGATGQDSIQRPGRP